MPDYTTIAIYPEDLEKLKTIAKADRRSNPMELRWLIEKELERREELHIESIQELPCPEGCNPVPLVTIRETK